MPRRFPHLQGDSRLYPFAARTALRRRQKHRAWALRLCGAAVLCLAAGLILRDTVFRGGQPEAPEAAEETGAGGARVCEALLRELDAATGAEDITTVSGSDTGRSET